MEQYKNIKNGKIYTVVNDHVINCTNKDDGKIMVLYTSQENETQLFVRELEEFKVKFKKCDDKTGRLCGV